MPPPATVVLTRSPQDNRPLREALAARGIRVVEVPTARIAPRPPDQGLDALWEALGGARAVTFTSRHGVDALAGHGGAPHVGALAARGGVIGAVGEATARAIEALGLPPPLRALPSTGAALAAALGERLRLPGARVVAVQALRARPELVDGLRAAGARVEIAALYDNTPPEAPEVDTLRACARADAVFVAAPSAATRLLDWAPGLRDRAFVAIGPTTAAALLERHGVVTRGVAQDPSEEAVLRAIVGVLPPDRGPC